VATTTSTPATAGTAASAPGRVAPDAGVHEAIPTTPAEIRAAFADVPRLENPDPFDRELARARFPDVVVPVEGQIPDPNDTITVDLEAPSWALATAFDANRDGAEPNPRAVVDRLIDMYSIEERWILPDGTDAVAAIVAGLRRVRDG